MKWFVYILSFYMLAVSCIPCMDEATTLEDSEQSISIIAHQQAEDSQEADLCSPLCGCSCCLGFVLLSVHHSITKAIVFSQTTKTHYKQESLSLLSFSIWQPPKI